MKLWAKGYDVNEVVERFTVQDDYLLDARLVPYDCQASRAHARMLHRAGLLSEEDRDALVVALDDLEARHERGEFAIRPEDEDCHTAIETALTQECGDAGKRIHTARSRNDQVLTALRLFKKDHLLHVQDLLGRYDAALESLVTRDGQIPLPGYTHMQKAMPASVAMWFGSFRASVADLEPLVRETLRLVDQCPAGTAAGFGVPEIEIDREGMARELGFSRLTENPMYAQMSRGKTEAQVAALCTAVLFDLNKLASDLILFSMPEFGFFRLPRELCTGSSIMPQKKNPDVLEVVRAKYYESLAAEQQIKSVIGSLISGYNRDVQLTKKPLFTALDGAIECLTVMAVVVDGLEIDGGRCRDAMDGELYATQKVYQLVSEGVPFREAYRQVASDVFSGSNEEPKK